MNFWNRSQSLHHATLTLCLAAGAGVILVVLGHRLHLPAIVLLLLGGVLLGPEGIGWVDPASLGHGLETVIALAVAVILFEGGLTLELDGYRRAPVVIKRLLSVGTLVTWLGTAAAVYFFFELKPSMALMAGSLVIVTGPTVVSPLLRRINVRERVHHALYWEGVLIDAVGVFVAVLCYEWLTPDESHPMWQPIVRFGLRFLVGAGLGLVVGWVVAVVLERDWIPREHVNIFVLACALATFGIAHGFLTESGILAVVVAGLVVGFRHPPQLRAVKKFKLQLTELGIGALFILLSAKLELSRFTGVHLLAVLGVVIFVLRPIAIWLSTWGRGFGTREKLFLSWIAPRGIVAAAMASLFAGRLQELGHPEAVHLETITFAIIASTVTLQGLSAPFVAKILGVQRPDHRTWVLVGLPEVVLALGSAMRKAGVRVIEVAGLEALEEVDPDDPKFADAHAVLFVGTSDHQSAWFAEHFDLDVPDLSRFVWSAPKDGGVWGDDLSALAVAEWLKEDTHVIDVLNVEAEHESGRFGETVSPLFWVNEGAAQLVTAPKSPGPPMGDMAIVLRKRVSGLAELVSHVHVFPDSDATFPNVLRDLAQMASRQFPDLSVDEIVHGITDRRESMPIAVGGGIAIPHAYTKALVEPRCFIGVVPEGVTDMVTPDELPVRVMCLLLSPFGSPKHLESLAALATLGRDQAFVDLLCRQRVPAKIAQLIMERS